MTLPLQLKLFASPQISYQGQPLNGFVSVKTRALLIYLAVRARLHNRDHWPNCSGPIRRFRHTRTCVPLSVARHATKNYYILENQIENEQVLNWFYALFSLKLPTVTGSLPSYLMQSYPILRHALKTKNVK